MNGREEILRAGPVCLKIADGELRYLRVGGKEVIRRVYHAVRDKGWDTPMPVFKRMEIDKGSDHFEIRMEASCRRDDLVFDWKGTITGSSDGIITFQVDGEPGSSFETPRIGFCVLYGSDSLSGQRLSLTHEDGSTTEDRFPLLVKPTLVADYHESLTYCTEDGIGVTVATENGQMRMEDQRNFGDSSYKSFTDNPYGDGKANQGVCVRQKLTISVQQESTRAREPVNTVGDAAPIPVQFERGDVEVVVPMIEVGTATPFVSFATLNRGRDEYRSLDKVVFGVTSGAHLYDNDTYLENATVVVPEVETLRSFTGQAKVRVDPVTMDAPYPSPDMKLEGGGRFAAVWCARMVKFLAIAGVDEMAFDVGEPEALSLLGKLAACTGGVVVPADIGPHEPVDAFAIVCDDKIELWIINKTLDEQRVALAVPKEWKGNGLPADGQIVLSSLEVATVLRN